MDGAAIVEFLAASIRIATPLLFGALGGLLSERAGTFAVGIEGMMLAGAFGGAVTTLLTADPGTGLAVSAGSGAAAGFVVAVATAKFRADHMVTGLALNILVVGLTSFLLRGLFGGQAPVIQLPTLKALPIPYLADLPGIGRVLFHQPALTYAALALTLAISVLLAKTRTGLMLRAVGENPEAAFTAGSNPVRVRMAAIVAGGALAGLGGAVLSLQEVGTFTDGMTNGRGFIALAAIIVGRWMPFPTLLGCLLFGGVAALELRVQGWDLPVSSYIIQMTPYLTALGVLAGIGRGARLPAAIGTAFTRN
jgi:general nucleoside transport system permease protein